jgi:hypothetical protein
MSNAELRGFRERFSRTPVQTDRQLRALIANYYGMISLIDHRSAASGRQCAISGWRRTR